MTTTSKINLDNLAESSLKDVLTAVDEGCLELVIDFYIVGAVARDVWFRQEQKAVIGTKDVDFAVLLSENHQFYNLKNLLISKHKFTSLKENAFTLLSPSGLQIDILPFGALEVEDGVAVDGSGLNKIKVNGFKEVYLESVQAVYVLEDKKFKVATLPAIFMLKLIAYDDRPEQRPNDPLDCFSIIENYFSLQSDLIYDFHNDLFGNDDHSLTIIGARVIGRELRKPLNRNPELHERVMKLLSNHVALEEKSAFILKMATQAYRGTDECVEYLREILNGINDELHELPEPSANVE